MQHKELNLAEWETEQSHYIRRAVKMRMKAIAMLYALIIIPVMAIVCFLIFSEVPDITLRFWLVLIYVFIPLFIGSFLVIVFIWLTIIIFKGVIIITKITDKGLYQYARYKHRWQEMIMMAPKHIFVPWKDIVSFKPLEDHLSIDLRYKNPFPFKDRIPHIICHDKNFRQIVQILKRYVPERK